MWVWLTILGRAIAQCDQDRLLSTSQRGFIEACQGSLFSGGPCTVLCAAEFDNLKACYTVGPNAQTPSIPSPRVPQQYTDYDYLFQNLPTLRLILDPLCVPGLLVALAPTSSPTFAPTKPPTKSPIKVAYASTPTSPPSKPRPTNGPQLSPAELCQSAGSRYLQGEQGQVVDCQQLVVLYQSSLSSAQCTSAQSARNSCVDGRFALNSCRTISTNPSQCYCGIAKSTALCPQAAPTRLPLPVLSPSQPSMDYYGYQDIVVGVPRGAQVTQRQVCYLAQATYPLKFANVDCSLYSTNVVPRAVSRTSPSPPARQPRQVTTAQDTSQGGSTSQRQLCLLGQARGIPALSTVDCTLYPDT